MAFPMQAFLSSFPFLPIGQDFPKATKKWAYLSTDTGALDIFNDSPADIIDDLQDSASKHTTPEKDHISSSALDEIPDQQVHTKLIVVKYPLLCVH